MFSSVTHARGRELLERLANTMLNSTRTVAKVNAGGVSSIFDIKMNLDSQLTAVEGNEDDLKSCDSCRSYHLLSAQYKSTSVLPNGHCVLHGVQPHPKVEQKPRIQIANLVPRDDIYSIEPELCDLLIGGGIRCIGGRGQCQSPVAKLIDQVYFIPVR